VWSEGLAAFHFPLPCMPNDGVQVKNNVVYAPHREKILLHIDSMIILLSQYLSVFGSPQTLLNNCLTQLDLLIKSIDQNDLISMNNKSFSEYAVIQ
jgi:hypothetical protein